MKQQFFILLLSTCCLASLSSCSNDHASKETTGHSETAISGDSLVSRGRYLVTIMGCNDCHSSKIMTPHGPVIDSAHMLGGHLASIAIPKVPMEAAKDWALFSPTLTAMVGPWGISYAANISSSEAGIGNWSEAQFFKAIREGKHKGMDNTRPLLPPMPWEMYRHASDDDLKAIFAYLKSTPPVDNVVPAPVPPDAMATK